VGRSVICGRVSCASRAAAALSSLGVAAKTAVGVADGVAEPIALRPAPAVTVPARYGKQSATAKCAAGTMHELCLLRNSLRMVFYVAMQTLLRPTAQRASSEEGARTRGRLHGRTRVGGKPTISGTGATTVALRTQSEIQPTAARHLSLKLGGSLK
jgi:hypothetical protein